MNKPEPLEKLIDALVVPQNFSTPTSLELKIELLSFILERLKHDRCAAGAEVTFEEFVQCDVNVHGSKLVISAPRTFKDEGAGTTSTQLQATLLLFLLLNRHERYRILDIIQFFVEQIRNELTYLDFKKTKTGVIRCFTNTRFAAHVLRDYGLLKFTKREAFKTWELSLAGFLVAATILQKRADQKNPWHLPGLAKYTKFDLLPEIRDACIDITNYDAFVARLASICKPDAEVFRTFEPALKQAFDLLEGYWELLGDAKKSSKERRQASLDRIKRLDTLGDDFFQELSSCIQINNLLRGIFQGEMSEGIV